MKKLCDTEDALMKSETATEKMVTLKIEVPARWAGFIDEFYKIAGIDRQEDLREIIAGSINGVMIENMDYLSIKERVRLMRKYELSDIRELYTWEHDMV